MLVKLKQLNHPSIPGTIIAAAVYATTRRKYNYESERERFNARQRAYRQRKRQKLIEAKEQDYSWIGEWSPEDELPDFDENGEIK
jgi:hypothetical protein